MAIHRRTVGSEVYVRGGFSLCLGLLGALVSLGCQSTNFSWDETTLANYEERAQTQEIESETIADLPKIINRRPAMPVGSLTTTQPSVAQTLEWQMPDPSVAPQLFKARLKTITDKRQRDDYERTSRAAVQHLQGLKRPESIKLTLAEAVHRALMNNYAIKIAGYEPAVSRAQIVEAEAQFDATFFANWTELVRDQATASSLQGNFSRNRTLAAGIRKLLSTGTQLEMSFNWLRTETDLAFQELNPAYNNDVGLQLVQPLLRGFGLDFNRSQIILRRNEERQNLETFRQNVRDTLLQTEQAYWQLVRARRNVTVTAELLAETEETYRYIEARRDFDAFQVLIANSQSRVETRRVALIRAMADAKEAEDTLKALLNDPVWTLSDDIEIIPVDIPEAVPIVVDRLAEIQTALDHRSELRLRDLQIEAARIVVSTAKNQVLPKLDVIFSYKWLGLGGNPHAAFSQLSENDFEEYTVGLQFEWPIGSRAARSQLRQAKLRYQQSVMSRKAQIEQIILDVNNAVRELNTAWDAINPSIGATVSAEQNVQATKARAERKSPSELETELSGQSTLATARQTFLDALIAYNIAIADLERAKGTLLKYNNVVLEEEELP